MAHASELIYIILTLAWRATQPCAKTKRCMADIPRGMSTQAGGTAARPLHLLRGQTGLWDHLLAAACMGAAEPGTLEARRVEKGRHEDDGSQAERCWDAWRLQAQAHATRILALSAYLPGKSEHNVQGICACWVNMQALLALFWPLQQ